MDLEPGTIIGGKYRIERPISRGGMGTVWAARHIQLESPVAIKVMDPEQAAAPDLVNRFFREARAAASIESPHVVAVKDFGVDHEAPYLVMELLRGEDLRARLRRARRLPLVDAARIAAQTARALRRAHELGIVHRDLKPANLYLAQIDGEEIVKVLDFGIAKLIEGHVSGQTTRAGELLGSPFYMSPEQTRGDRDLDARSDLWSLAVILFQTVTGALPFQGDVLGAVIAQILEAPVPRATAIDPALPQALDAFFAKALSREREERFQSAPELAASFAAAAGVSIATAEARATTRTGTVIGLGALPGDRTAPLPDRPSRPAPGDTSTPAAAAPPSSRSAPDGAAAGHSGEPLLDDPRALTAPDGQPGTLTSATAVSAPGSAARVGLGALAGVAVAAGIAVAVLRPWPSGALQAGQEPAPSVVPAPSPTVVISAPPSAAPSVASASPLPPLPTSSMAARDSSPAASPTASAAPPPPPAPFGVSNASTARAASPRPSATPGSTATQPPEPPTTDIRDPWATKSK